MYTYTWVAILNTYIHACMHIYIHLALKYHRSPRRPAINEAILRGATFLNQVLSLLLKKHY